MRHLLLVRVTVALVFVLGIAAAWAAQIGEGMVFTAQSSLYELHSMELTPDRRLELVAGLERLSIVQINMFNAFLYGGMVLSGLACGLFHLAKPKRTAT